MKINMIHTFHFYTAELSLYTVQTPRFPLPEPTILTYCILVDVKWSHCRRGREWSYGCRVYDGNIGERLLAGCKIENGGVNRKYVSFVCSNEIINSFKLMIWFSIHNTKQYWVKLFSLSMNFHALKQSVSNFMLLCSRVALCTAPKIQCGQYPQHMHTHTHQYEGARKKCLICSSETNIKTRKGEKKTPTHSHILYRHTKYTAYILMQSERETVNIIIS